MARRKKKSSRLKITHTKIEPKWVKQGRGAMKSLKRVMFNTLAIVGLITVIVLIARSL